MVRATIDLGCIIKKSPTAGGAVGVILWVRERRRLGGDGANRVAVSTPRWKRRFDQIVFGY